MTNAGSSSLRSFHINRRKKYRKLKQVSQDKVQSNGEIRNGETFRIFSFLRSGLGGQSDGKSNGGRECKVLYEEEETV